jgi:hypothetical protein
MPVCKKTQLNFPQKGNSQILVLAASRRGIAEIQSEFLYLFLTFLYYPCYL